MVIGCSSVLLSRDTEPLTNESLIDDGVRRECRRSNAVAVRVPAVVALATIVSVG